MSVNAVRKQSSDEEVQILAKALIKSWKKLLGKYVFVCVSVYCVLFSFTSSWGHCYVAHE